MESSIAFLQTIEQTQSLNEVIQVQVLLYGSLAKTGKGHGTDIAVILGLCGEDPETIDVNSITPVTNGISQSKQMMLGGKQQINFDPAADVSFLFTESLPFHPNGLSFLASFKMENKSAKHFIPSVAALLSKKGGSGGKSNVELPFPVNTANDLLHWCMKTGLSISEVVWENEHAWRSEDATKNGLLRIWQTMKDCIYRGCHSKGELPGGLHVRRRAF